VRFGDAEAQLLLTSPADSDSIGAVLGRLERESGLPMSATDAHAIKANLALAFERADVLGILPRDRSNGDHKELMGELVELHAGRMTADQHPVQLTSCMLGHQLLDELPEMLAGRRVSVISCRDVKPILEDDWGLGDVVVYQVPSQYECRDVDGAYEASLHHLPIWPDALAQTRSNLTVRRRGEVFLIAVGIFGKDLCIHVRDQGGIAVDMGSALDRLAGKITRGPKRRLVELYTGGMPAGEIAHRLGSFFGMEIGAEAIAKTLEETVSDDLSVWCSRPLKTSYPTICFAALPVAIGTELRAQRHTCWIGLGITASGRRDPLGIWWQDLDADAAADTVLEDLQRRGFRDPSVIHIGDGLSFLALAVEAAFPEATLQTTSNPIESLAAVRRATESHGQFVDERAATTLVYLALRQAEARSRTARPGG
jgi:hypothetical protein